MWLIAALLAAETQAPTLPVWMAGCWENESAGRSTVECWSMPDGNVMSGESVTTAAGKVVERESMQIVHAETDDPAIPWMTFWAVPTGSKRTGFDWVPTSQPGLVFVNSQHDFPQRIRYWREGKFLMAEISAADGSKARRWRYTARGR
jgi:hypothetical protein